MLSLKDEGISLGVVVTHLAKHLLQEKALVKEERLGGLLVELGSIEERLALDCSDQVQMGALVAAFQSCRA